MAADSYRMVMGLGTGAYEEKRSRFVASVAPVHTEEEAVAFIREVRSRGWDARHHCHAFALDDAVSIRRSSDDGEPSGTAGVPILEVLNKQGLTNTVIVVSRWFGGVLLGAAGLLRAYGKAASLGVADAGIQVVKTCFQTTLVMEYTLSGKLEHHLAQAGYLTGETEYGADVRMHVFLEPERREALEREVADLTAARVEVLVGEPIRAAFSEAGAFLRILPQTAATTD